MKNVLAVGAHFDDVELGCGGTLIKHLQAGDKVTILVVSHSGYTTKNGFVRRRDDARKEGKKAADIIGVKDMKCLEYATQNVPFNMKLIEEIYDIIVELKIDIIYTHWVHDIHPDHAAVGRACLSAARHIPCILMYRSNWYSTFETFKEHFYVDISEVINQKLKAVKAYKSEYDKYGPIWVDFVKQQNRSKGLEMETKFAEVFEIVRYLK